MGQVDIADTTSCRVAETQTQSYEDGSERWWSVSPRGTRAQNCSSIPGDRATQSKLFNPSAAATWRDLG